MNLEVDLEHCGPELWDFQDSTLNSLESYLSENSYDHFYANPMFTVRATPDVPDEEFLKQAEVACIEWLRLIRKVLGRGAFDRKLKPLNPVLNAASSVGFLYLNGMPVPAKRLKWRASIQKATS